MNYCRLLYLMFCFSLFFLGKSLYAQSSTYVIVHGAWGGAWQFKNMAIELEKKGNKIYRPTLTGLGERYHLADTAIRLQTHVNDVVNTILFEDLHDIILVGHSYGGMVITAVADSLPDRIRKMVYLDAILPKDQQSVMDLMRKPDTDNGLLKFEKDGYILPFWVKDDNKFPRDVPHPLKTVTDKIHLINPKRNKIPTTYILTYEDGTALEKDDFYPFYKEARNLGFKTIEFVGDHNPQIKKLKELVDLLECENK
ncbi:alpha/beta hydrolase [uncultured Sphingobacterium sp.]|uniref:alpha/beta fold hydrolase n=1 Tax=uncultured Sphingobacterium sp. TaxID=182688 RepID=UPI0025CDB5B7|nr:alpha/beta hydrolase [uncultured Sphingobacterium sp.]